MEIIRGSIMYILKSLEQKTPFFTNCTAHVRFGTNGTKLQKYGVKTNVQHAFGLEQMEQSDTFQIYKKMRCMTTVWNKWNKITPNF